MLCSGISFLRISFKVLENQRLESISFLLCALLLKLPTSNYVIFALTGRYDFMFKTKLLQK